jgi:hypothetical protein
MGCSTCKSKRKNSNKDKNVTFEKVNSVDNTTPKSNGSNNNKEERIDTKVLSGLSELAPQGVFMKFIVFCSVLVAIPLFAVYLIGYIFKMFFLTAGNNSGSLSFVGLFRVLTYPKRKWKSFRGNLREKARQREFAKTVSYDDMSDVDVFVNEEVKEKREYTGELELEGVELLETTNKDNDNG